MFPAGAKVTAAVAGGKKKFHLSWPDETEVVEEYDLSTDLLLHRRIRRRTQLGGKGGWTIEVGEDEGAAAASGGGGGGGGAAIVEGLMESSDNPIVVRKDSRESFQWRIRNLPYPLETYNISVEEAKSVVVRTTNKKYFKKLTIPDMERGNLPLEQAAVSFSHANRTLVITYRKPQPVLDAEKEWKTQRAKMQTNKEGDVECPQQ